MRRKRPRATVRLLYIGPRIGTISRGPTSSSDPARRSTPLTIIGATPLWAASLNGSMAMVGRLLEAGANPNAALLSGETPLMAASRAGKPLVVEQLLKKGASPNARATRGQTALMWAVGQQHSDVVKVLLAGGADVHARTDVWEQMMAVPPHGLPEYNRMIPQGGDTALMFAARVGDLESARILIAGGANASDQDAWGVSATTLAAFAGHGEIARLLLEKGADPNAEKSGFTALHCAIMRRDEPTVAALLARGADPNVTVKVWTPTRRSSDDYHFMPALVGASPFWLAARFTQPGIMRLLAKHGADTKVIHESNYVQGEGYQRRQERTTAVMAALGMGGGTAWMPVDRARARCARARHGQAGHRVGRRPQRCQCRWPYGTRFGQGAEVRSHRCVSRIQRRHSRNQQEVIAHGAPAH